MRIYSISREIGIDAGHRVTHHGSKCKNLHGHRYTIEAHCEGQLFEQGEQQGMVLDFGFLKEEMMQEIDAPCDHGTILWVEDPFIQYFKPTWLDGAGFAYFYDMPHLRKMVESAGYLSCNSLFGKLYLLDCVPTAENLAAHWFKRLAPRVAERTEGLARLTKVVVWETPNCKAEYYA